MELGVDSQASTSIFATNSCNSTLSQMTYQDCGAHGRSESGQTPGPVQDCLRGGSGDLGNMHAEKSQRSTKTQRPGSAGAARMRRTPSPAECLARLLPALGTRKRGSPRRPACQTGSECFFPVLGALLRPGKVRNRRDGIMILCLSFLQHGHATSSS